MSINLNRFNAQQISPLEDVRLFSRVFTVNGILQGCVLTHLGANQVRITSGIGIIGGGDFEVVQEDLLVALSSSGTVPGRIYIRINLSDTVTPIKIMSVAANPLPALTQTANFYETNGIWEMELATYSATTTAISGLTTKYISITDVFDNYLKKSLVANTQEEVNAITVDGVPCGTKPVKEIITSLNGVLKSQTLLATATTTGATITNVANINNFREVLIVIKWGTNLVCRRIVPVVSITIGESENIIIYQATTSYIEASITFVSGTTTKFVWFNAGLIPTNISLYGIN